MKMKIIITTVSLFLGTAILIAGEGERRASMKTTRSGASAVEYNGRIYVIGGRSMNNNTLNTVALYDIATDTWDTETVPGFTHARYDAAAMVWKDKVFLIGGISWNNQVLKKVEVYDLVQNKWFDVHGLHKERTGHTVVELSGHMFVIGGLKHKEQNDEYLDEIEWFDDQEGEFEKAEFKMVSPRSAQFSAVVDDVYYMFGGSYFGGAQKTAWKAVRDYGASAGNSDDIIYKWYPLPDLPVARYYGATAVHDSLIYLIGGTDGEANYNRIDIFNTKTDKFIGTTTLEFGRSGMASATVDSNTFLIGGHSDGWRSLDEVYRVYNLGTAVSELTSAESVDRLMATAYPNPFTSQVALDIVIPWFDTYQISVFNLLGQKIRSLKNDRMHPGKHTISWDATDEYGRQVVAGAYFISIRNRNQHRLVKLIYVK